MVPAIWYIYIYIYQIYIISNIYIIPFALSLRYWALFAFRKPKRSRIYIYIYIYIYPCMHLFNINWHNILIIKPQFWLKTLFATCSGICLFHHQALYIKVVVMTAEWYLIALNWLRNIIHSCCNNIDIKLVFSAFKISKLFSNKDKVLNSLKSRYLLIWMGGL